MIDKDYITALKHRGSGDVAALINAQRDVGGVVFYNDCFANEKQPDNILLPAGYEFLKNDNPAYPVFYIGDSLTVLKKIPSGSIDFCMTSPPYWGQRCYENGGIGMEHTPEHFIANLLEVTKEIKRVLKDSGSFWFNIGDTYRNKSLQGIPWRIAIKMMDEQRWILRNDVVWNKHKGAMDSSADKLRNIHEMLFHFVKTSNYYYNADAIRQNPQTTVVRNGAVVSSSGVCGIRYRRQIELSTALSSEEKENAMRDLQHVLKKIENSEIPDFRMIIRNQQRATHSDSEKVSGRARELKEKGYYFLFYSKNGALPADVWEILPEDTQHREKHYAVYPEDLCKVPILATCPPDGIVLDPFCGSGTTNKVAYDLHRKSIGIDISEKYIDIARQRVSQLHLNLV
ncbi:MAG: site-specific DNA-methyltransferase [Prevotellaceae bacterium]|jgi:site-specific DNA-methyltransferase (adenine-specific)|nr:site-specific DNA-methyltransferase [Prevotellaceae bacterium]